MQTHEEIRDAIGRIVEARRRAAAASAYDRKVCILAVATAAEAIERVPVSGTPRDYLASVVATLLALRDSYYDPDGEYTSGASDIGSVYELVRDLRPAG